MYKTWLCIIR